MVFAKRKRTLDDLDRLHVGIVRKIERVCARSVLVERRSLAVGADRAVKSLGISVNVDDDVFRTDLNNSAFCA